VVIYGQKYYSVHIKYYKYVRRYIEVWVFSDTSERKEMHKGYDIPLSVVSAVNTKSKKRASVSITKETKGLLDAIKHTGQSYDGLIRELVMYREEQKELEATK